MNGVAMNTFTIDAPNNITAFASLEEARAAKINNAEYFGSAQELAKLAASWPARRPVEIWNSFAGAAPFTSLKPVKKFPNRKAAVADIWKAVRALSASVAIHTALSRALVLSRFARAFGIRKGLRGLSGCARIRGAPRPEWHPLGTLQRLRTWWRRKELFVAWKLQLRRRWVRRAWWRGLRWRRTWRRWRAPVGEKS